MRAVPRLVGGGIAQAEVGAQVDHPHAALTQVCDERRGRAVRVGHDGGVHFSVAVEVELLKLERHAVVRVELASGARRCRARGEALQLERGMAVQQPRGRARR